MTVRQIIDGLERLGSRAALVSSGRAWTGAEVLDRTYRAVTALRQRGAVAGRSLSWSAGDAPQALPVRLAAMLLGARFSAEQPASDGGDVLRITDADLPALDGASACEPRLADDAPFSVVRGSFVWSRAVFCESVAALRDALGPSPARTAVLSPLAGFGGDAVFASWSAGAAVHPHVVDASAASPARALSFLERAAPDCAIVSAALLRSLLAHPAAALADLGALRRIVYDAGAGAGGALSAESSAAVRRVFGAELVDRIAGEAGLVPVERELRRAEQEAARIAELVMSQPSVAAAAAIPSDGDGWAIFAVPAKRAGDDADGDASGQRLIASVTAALDAELAGTDVNRAIAAVERLGRTALLSMLNALGRSGLFTDTAAAHTVDEVLARARVAAAHRPLLRRWLRVLTEQKLLRRDGDLLSAVGPIGDHSDAALARAWDELKGEWLATVGATGTIDYAVRNSDRLPDLISGAVRAVHLLFPEGRTDLARALYRESVAARYQHRAVSLLVSRIAKEWPGQRPVRLLEVGAGTGATSESLLPELSGAEVDYLYTDVSRYFLDQAAPRLAGHRCVRFGLYDINVAPRDQGFVPNSFDVIIGGGVLNAARNTDASLRWLNELLGPGGWLVLTEPTVEEFWVMASQAFMLDDASDGRAETESTFLSLPQWNAALDGAGLRRVLGLPRDGHPLERLGHRVFAARTKMDRTLLTSERLSEHLGESLGAAARIEIVDELPLAAGGALDRERLRDWAARRRRFDSRPLPAAASQGRTQ
ncbi:class I SAM-dependent methyltransferase [Sorangium atrum]|uniref:Methyltransferase n=1 Tax=Sorangium atrum TaxID=2995308 RepID=A0ABT5CDD5_9BACT|nr:methyltransferase [Sorangium aterium]MDC0684454.1 methyltransferase [Sorangium aterium]